MTPWANTLLQAEAPLMTIKFILILTAVNGETGSLTQLLTQRDLLGRHEQVEIGIILQDCYAASASCKLEEKLCLSMQRSTIDEKS
jgi:hypothetical protein